ncbi:MAG: DUF1249 domain-containing protein [Gammaproteobacteria bacterium]|nr:MAG: DUF1249 domain-containing protein [Gammaproteobacteria bacterium]
MGRLVSLCEENYDLLLRLVPELRQMEGDYRARCPGHADLHLTILERGRYTTLLRLTYRFEDGRDAAEPDAVLRVYHDAREVEAVALRQSVLSTGNLYEAPALANKWQLNWFVTKWLGFCVSLDYRFENYAQEPVEVVS